MADTNPPAERRVATRTTNADQHPGQVVPIRKRRTKAEMAQDKALADEKKPKKNARKPKVLHALQSSKTKWPLTMLVLRAPTHETRKVHVSFFSP